MAPMAWNQIESSSSGWWRRPRHLLSVAAIVAAFGFLAWQWPTAVAWERAAEPARLAALVGFALLFGVALMLRALRWHWLMIPQLNERYSVIFVAYAWFFAVGGFTPMRSGEILRIGWVKARGGSGAFAAGAFLAEKLSDVIALLLLLGLGVTVAGVAPEPVAGLPRGLVVLLVVSYLLLMLFGGRIRRWLVGGTVVGRLGGLLDRFLYAFPTMGAGGTFWILHGLTLAVWGLLMVGFWGYLTACYPGIHWSAAPMCLALVNLSALVGGPPGNLGVYEAMFAVVLKVYGIGSEQAIVAAVVLHAVALAVTALIGAGCGWLMWHDKNGHFLKRGLNPPQER